MKTGWIVGDVLAENDQTKCLSGGSKATNNGSSTTINPNTTQKPTTQGIDQIFLLPLMLTLFDWFDPLHQTGCKILKHTSYIYLTDIIIIS